MKFFDDMLDKFGFSDGDAMPLGIDKYRKVYVETINHFAEYLGSSQQVEPYDRPGMHNSCLIVFIDTKGNPVNGIRRDQKMEEAISMAMDFNPDQYVEVTTTIAQEDFDKDLAEFEPEK